MKKKYLYYSALFIIATLLLSLLFFNTKDDQISVPLRYGSVRAIVEAPAHVAYHNGFFQDEGLNVSLEINPDGKTSLDRLLLDSIDIASVMATPVVFRSFRSDDFYIIGVMEFSEKIHSGIAHKDRGIHLPVDLKGKNVGVMKGTSGEFYMNSFLILHDLIPEDLNIVDMNGPQMLDAMVSGDLDAMFCWEPYILLAKLEMDSSWIEFTSDKLIPSSWVFVARKNYVDDNPEIIKKFLKSILEGTRFTNEQKEQTLNIHSQMADVNKDHIKELLYKQTFNLSLKQELILDLEAQARWLVDFEYVPDSVIPDFYNIIYLDAVKEIVPDQANFIK
jgi:ABC-type nitrate/sulfonate/bicarbonate transport system substrate-binding protein